MAITSDDSEDFEKLNQVLEEDAVLYRSRDSEEEDYQEIALDDLADEYKEGDEVICPNCEIEGLDYDFSVSLDIRTESEGHNSKSSREPYRVVYCSNECGIESSIRMNNR